MAGSLIPTDAPFEQEQRRFVEGFLTGLVSVRTAQQAVAPNADAAGTPLTIAYGSQSGNCEALSKDLRKYARASGFKPDIVELNALDHEALADIRHLLIVCSTFGEGDSPDNAKRFVDGLHCDDAPRLPALSFSVCALGDRSYTHFCKTGIDIDHRLGELDATRLHERIDCDVAFEDDWDDWKQGVFATDTMIEAAGEVSAQLEEQPPDPGTAAWTKANPFPATLLRVRCLNAEGSAKEVNHIELSLAGSGLEYAVGDALGVWPVNCADLVQELLERGGFVGDEPVQIRGEAWPLRAALLRKLDLNTLTPNTIETLRIEQPIDALGDLHLIDLLEHHGATITAQQLVDALRPLQPRLYSIASSPKPHPGQVHLTVGAVRYCLRDRPRKGVASTLLADRLHVGSTVGVYVQKASHFHLPENPETPIIMVGPGTGIAPFRAFLEERQAIEAAGPSWLFFGDQHEATDFLYREQLESMLDDGTLTRLDLAWSRDGREKTYVQHRMLQAGAQLWDWLSTGAHFYVCGDASRMASDVDQALRQIVAEHGQMPAPDASAWVDALTAEGRYQRDVY